MAQTTTIDNMPYDDMVRHIAVKRNRIVPHSSPNDTPPAHEDAHGDEFSRRVRGVVVDILAGLREPRGALLPILHGVQRAFAFVPSAAIPIIADELNLTRAEVHGVVTFYSDFRETQPGRHIVRICQSESCQALGSRALTARAEAELGIGFNEKTSDGAFTLEPVYCLGNCALSPAVQVDSTVHGRVTPERLLRILEDARKAS